MVEYISKIIGPSYRESLDHATTATDTLYDKIAEALLQGMTIFNKSIRVVNCYQSKQSDKKR